MPKLIFSNALIADPTSQYLVLDDSWPESMVPRHSPDALLEQGRITEREITVDYCSEIRIITYGFYTHWLEVTKDSNGDYHCNGQIDNLIVSSDSDYNIYVRMGLFETLAYKYPRI